MESDNAQDATNVSKKIETTLFDVNLTAEKRGAGTS
jgi:hypothetical protein